MTKEEFLKINTLKTMIELYERSANESQLGILKCLKLQQTPSISKLIAMKSRRYWRDKENIAKFMKELETLVEPHDLTIYDVTTVRSCACHTVFSVMAKSPDVT